MAPTAPFTPQLHGIVQDPLAAMKFTLNAFGVAGFFGGETAVNGMATVIFFLRRRWGGLYNTPGSLEIAKRYGQLASPSLFRGLFPGDTRDPSQLFGLDDKTGPKFLAARSGSLFEKTGHLGHLLARMAKNETCTSVLDSSQRITTPSTVTIINLNHLDGSNPCKIVHPSLESYAHYGFWALIPIVASIGACIGCALVGDWWSFSSITLGMIANGWACFVLGSGKLTFQHPMPAGNTPRGDGILWAAENAVVVVLGTECAVNTITRGHFFLQYRDCHCTHCTTTRPQHQPGAGNNGPESRKPDSLFISISSILLTIQFVAQLLLIPQASVFGQLMFVSTLAASWGYNVFISSIDSENVQTRHLCNILELKQENTTVNREEMQRRVQKFEFGTWTAMAVFACLALRQPTPVSAPASSAASTPTSSPAPTPAPEPASTSTPRPTSTSAPGPASTPVPNPETATISTHAPIPNPHIPASTTGPESKSTPAPKPSPARATITTAPELISSSDPTTIPAAKPILAPTTGPKSESSPISVPSHASASESIPALEPSPVPAPSAVPTPNPAPAASPLPLSNVPPAPIPTSTPITAHESSHTPPPGPSLVPNPVPDSSFTPTPIPEAESSAAAQLPKSSSPAYVDLDLSKVLDALIPNGTEVWNEWKAAVGKQLACGDFTKLQDPTSDRPPLLKLLIDDAKVAYDRYSKHYLPTLSPVQLGK